MEEIRAAERMVADPTTGAGLAEESTTWARRAMDELVRVVEVVEGTAVGRRTMGGGKASRGPRWFWE